MIKWKERENQSHVTTTYYYHAGKNDADEGNLKPHSIFQIEQAPQAVVKI